MARRKINSTKHEIIKQATTLFLERGYTATTPKLICDCLDISTGNLTYYFPTKEHLLTVLITMLCRFQSKLLHELVEEEGKTSLLAACLELATITASSEESEIAREMFIAAYASPMCLSVIRKNDTQRAKEIYAEYCPGWTDQQHIEAEILVSGIEYATLMTAGDPLPLEVRITGALNNIMQIYNVPEEIRKQKIQKILAMDYRAIARNNLEDFRKFVDETTEHGLDALLV